MQTRAAANVFPCFTPTAIWCGTVISQKNAFQPVSPIIASVTSALGRKLPLANWLGSALLGSGYGNLADTPKNI